MDKAALPIGAIAFIHRFGSSLNGRVHFHVCVVDGVFEEVELFDWTTLEQPLVADSFQPTRDNHGVKSYDSLRPRPAVHFPNTHRDLELPLADPLSQTLLRQNAGAR